MTEHRARICTLGSINMDLVARAPRLPRPGETLLGSAFSTSPGGKGANQAVAAARMSADVSFIGAVGDDPHGREMLALLSSEGIDTSRILTRPGIPTGIAAITVGDDGENTIVVAPGANATLTPADIDAARPLIAAADILLMQLEVPLDAVIRGAELAHDLGATVILNAAPAHTLPAALLANIDILVVNETEALAAAASLAASPFAPSRPLDPAEPSPLLDELDALIARLGTLGIPAAVLTAGARGALFSRGREPPGRIPACPASPVDTVGAGDAFCGALAVRLAEHQIGGQRTAEPGPDRMSIMDSVCWACAAGALATTKPGAIPSLPTRAEVIRLLRMQP